MEDSISLYKQLADDLIAFAKKSGVKSCHLEEVAKKDQKIISEYITSLGYKSKARPDFIKGHVILEISLA